MPSAIERDHQALLDDLDAVRDAAVDRAPERARALACQLRDALAVHAAREEAIGQDKPGMRYGPAIYAAEHARIATLAGRLVEALERPAPDAGTGRRQALDAIDVGRALRDLLVHHFEREQADWLAVTGPLTWPAPAPRPALEVVEPSAVPIGATYLHLLDDRVRIVLVGDDFWPTLDARRDLDPGRLLMEFVFDGPWPSWERHPAGDEVVGLREGAMTLILERPQGPVAVPLRPGEAVVVPRGVWHTADVDRHAIAWFLTPGEGTTNEARGPDGARVAGRPWPAAPLE